MPSRKTSYHMPEIIADYFADVDRAGDTMSGRMTSIFLRYRRLCREHMPPLDRDQWCAVADANNGTNDLMVGDQADASLAAMWPNVADTPGLAEKWGIDQDDLVRTMRGWSYVQQVAAREAVRTFWAHTDEETDEALRLAGMVGPAT